MKMPGPHQRYEDETMKGMLHLAEKLNPREAAIINARFADGHPAGPEEVGEQFRDSRKSATD
jgi:DNA-directed RNA polymerase sigma subunit (sigma70/sigma32)